MKKILTPQEQQKKLIQKLTKKEKELGCKYDTPLSIAIESAQNATDEDIYWRQWKALYNRLSPLFDSQNAFSRVLDLLDAPLCLEREMSGTYWKD